MASIYFSMKKHIHLPSHPSTLPTNPLYFLVNATKNSSYLSFPLQQRLCSMVVRRAQPSRGFMLKVANGDRNGWTDDDKEGSVRKPTDIFDTLSRGFMLKVANGDGNAWTDDDEDGVWKPTDGDENAATTEAFDMGENEDASKKANYMIHISGIVAFITMICYAVWYTFSITLTRLFRRLFRLPPHFVIFPLKQRKIILRAMYDRTFFIYPVGTSQQNLPTTPSKTHPWTWLSEFLVPVFAVFSPKFMPITNIKTKLITIYNGINYVIEFYYTWKDTIITGGITLPLIFIAIVIVMLVMLCNVWWKVNKIEKLLEKQ